jgi:hypothetical protein
MKFAGFATSHYQKKHRRTIFGDTFSVFNALCTVIGYVPHPDDKISRYVCGYCFTKLNKLTKIEYDLAHRLDSLTAEKNALIITEHVLFVKRILIGCSYH